MKIIHRVYVRVSRRYLEKIRDSEVLCEFGREDTDDDDVLCMSFGESERFVVQEKASAAICIVK